LGVCADIDYSNAEASADKIKEYLVTLFAHSTYWDRTGTALVWENDENKKMAFYASLGYVLASALSQGSDCGKDINLGYSYVAFRNQKSVECVVLFRIKRCNEEFQTCPFFQFNDFNGVHRYSFVIAIDLNIDFNSLSQQRPFDCTIYDNEYTQGIYKNVTPIPPRYEHNKNFVASMMHNGNFDANYIQAILRGIPAGWRIGAHETYFTCLLAFLFSFLGNCDAHHQEPVLRGRTDICLFCGPNSPLLGYIIEAKLNRSAEEAYNQIINKGYIEKFRGQGTKQVCLVGLNIDSTQNEIVLQVQQKLSIPSQVSPAKKRLKRTIDFSADDDKENVSANKQ